MTDCSSTAEPMTDPLPFAWIWLLIVTRCALLVTYASSDCHRLGEFVSRPPPRTPPQSGRQWPMAEATACNTPCIHLASSLLTLWLKNFNNSAGQGYLPGVANQILLDADHCSWLTVESCTYGNQCSPPQQSRHTAACSGSRGAAAAAAECPGSAHDAHKATTGSAYCSSGCVHCGGTLLGIRRLHRRSRSRLCTVRNEHLYALRTLIASGGSGSCTGYWIEPVVTSVGTIAWKRGCKRSH